MDRRSGTVSAERREGGHAGTHPDCALFKNAKGSVLASCYVRLCGCYTGVFESVSGKPALGRDAVGAFVGSPSAVPGVSVGGNGVTKPWQLHRTAVEGCPSRQ